MQYKAITAVKYTTTYCNTPPPHKRKKLSSSEYVTTQPELISSNNRTVIARELVLYTQSTMTAMSGQQWDSGDLLISRMIHIGC